MTVTDAMVEAADAAFWGCNPHLPLKEKMRLALEAGIAKATVIADAPDMAALLKEIADADDAALRELEVIGGIPLEEGRAMSRRIRAARRKAGVYPEVTK